MCSCMTFESAREWAVGQFGRAELGDTRWRRRLIAMGMQAARRPGGKVCEVFANAAERQGAYGLLECPEVNRPHVAQAVFAADARRCAKLPFVFAAVDGSSISLTDTAHAKGFGSIGTRYQGVRGLKVISALLVSPQGVTLGLGSQVWWARTGAPASRRAQRRRTGEKETRHWLAAMEQTRSVMAAHASETRLWFQLDREGDAWPILMAADHGGHWFTIRGNHNRRVTLPNGSTTYLRELVELQSVACEYPLSVSAGSGRAARQAKMVVRACRATLDFIDNVTKRHLAKTVNVVLAREQGTTPAGEKPIEWLLLTNRSIGTVEELTQVVLGYAQRWRIEDFHRTWKSGACGVEQMQLRSVAAAEKWATMLAAVAIRIERLKLLSRKEPERPASDEFNPIELRAIALLRFGVKASQHLPASAKPTIKQAVQWLAEIGGYTGKSSGGPPGSVTIGRGLREVNTAARALTAMEATCD